MKPPYDISPLIMKLIASISLKLGEVNARYISRHSPLLRKSNRIKTIHSSLQIEGNTLSEDQVTAIIENKRIIGPPKDIKEVKNAIGVYENLPVYKPSAEKSFLRAHKMLMEGLMTGPGKYRVSGVGIVKGSQVAHVAPPANKVPYLMNELFDYLESDELVLIKSCVFHYETEFIHPFLDGNGRMGRIWQTLILMEKYPVFEYLPFETLISKTQVKYYAALSKADKAGKSTPFIEYMLKVIDESLDEMLRSSNRTMTDRDRIEYYLSLPGKTEFTRKDYMNVFRDISTATASRDLKNAVDMGKIIKTGMLNKARYRAG